MLTAHTPKRFGVFMPPVQFPVTANPTLVLERNLQMAELADRVGFDEFWTGEHHSGGYELVGTPEIFLAVAAQRTQRIKLGSGVVSVPYHHPFHVAERAVTMDHLTRGRYILGVGPGSLTSDAHMLGLEVSESRRRLAEGLDSIVRLIDGEVVSKETDWFTLRDARLQLRSYTQPRVEMVAAAIASPTGPKNAGKYGLGMVNFGALSPQAFEALRGHWDIVEHEAGQAGQTCSRDGWRLAGVTHLAESEKQAREDLRYGFDQYVEYHSSVGLLPELKGRTFEARLEEARELGIVIYGTPDSAIEVIERLGQQAGGFGCFLKVLIDIVKPSLQRRSVELFAEEVIPHFTGQVAPRQQSYDWVLNDLGGGRDEWEKAVVAASEQYARERDVS